MCFTPMLVLVDFMANIQPRLGYVIVRCVFSFHNSL